MTATSKKRCIGFRYDPNARNFMAKHESRQPATRAAVFALIDQAGFPQIDIETQDGSTRAVTIKLSLLSFCEDNLLLPDQVEQILLGLDGPTKHHMLVEGTKIMNITRSK